MAKPSTTFRCVYCSEKAAVVISCTIRDDRPLITRRRKCSSCGREFMTYETPESNKEMFSLLRKAERKLLDAAALLRKINI